MANAVQMLRDDHRHVKSLFKRFEATSSHAQKKRIVDAALTELEVHAEIEEALFYPAVRQRIGDQFIMDEADEEHRLAKQLVAELRDMAPGESHYDAKFIVLAENVRHHIKEEEEEMFPKITRSGLDLDTLGEQMAQRKAQLLPGSLRSRRRLAHA